MRPSVPTVWYDDGPGRALPRPPPGLSPCCSGVGQGIGMLCDPVSLPSCLATGLSASLPYSPLPRNSLPGSSGVVQGEWYATRPSVLTVLSYVGPGRVLPPLPVQLVPWIVSLTVLVWVTGSGMARSAYWWLPLPCLHQGLGRVGLTPALVFRPYPKRVGGRGQGTSGSHFGPLRLRGSRLSCLCVAFSGLSSRRVFLPAGWVGRLVSFLSSWQSSSPSPCGSWGPSSPPPQALFLLLAFGF